jgi:Common central domain of tyrosinase/Polyphenol oxidase middle domain
MRPTTISIGALFVFAASSHNAAAQSPQFVPAYPLYCQGPLTTGAPSGGETTTPFQWASVGAGAANPAPGQCVWADRGPRGTEIQSGGGNVICDWSSAMQSVPAGTFVEVGVARDPIVGNCMHLFRYIGAVSGPFSGVPFLQPFTRQSIATLTSAQIASLQKGIQVMMSRPVTDPTSYRFQANIHGTLDTPTTTEEMQSWNQCEHGSFYFPSWHRMYLYFFDRILRAAAGDPNLALPYWDWTDPAQRTLPLPFQQPANASNSLYIAPPGRPTGVDNGTFSLSSSAVDDSGALADVDFDTGGSLGNGFGSGPASPAQFNSATGDLEMQPHNIVHSDLGGLMSVIDTAAQDPIFWLHHANIDRLWNKWIEEGGGRADPSDAAWLNTTFTFYDEAGHAVYLTGAEVVDTVGQLNYRYDDDPPAPKFIRFPIILAESASARGEQRITLGASPVIVRLPINEQTRQALDHAPPAD